MNSLKVYDMANEIWRPMTINQIKTCNIFDDYEVSNFGRVRNKVTKQILPIFGDTLRYVKLCSNGIPIWMLVDRLVALAFIPNDTNELVNYISHIDGDLENNKVDNLEWVNDLELFKKIHLYDSYHHKVDLPTNINLNYDEFQLLYSLIFENLNRTEIIEIMYNDRSIKLNGCKYSDMFTCISRVLNFIAYDKIWAQRSEKAR